jgi:single-strand DNA-binding protein
MTHPTEVQVTLVGVAETEPEFMICANGQARAAFRLTVPERRFDRAADAWLTARLNLYRVVCWRALAEHVGASVGRGDPVVVTGRQRVVEWSREGRRGTVVEIDAATVGHDLRCGTSRFRRVVRRSALPGRGGEAADEFLLDQQFPGLADAKAAARAALPPDPAPGAPADAQDGAAGARRPLRGGEGDPGQAPARAAAAVRRGSARQVSAPEPSVAVSERVAAPSKL